LIVADDRGALRHLSRFLNAFGYEVQQAATPELARAALEGEAPDVLIVDFQGDAPRVLELCPRIADQDGPSYIYTFLLIRDRDAEHMEDLAETLEAGVDDFLAKRFVTGRAKN
jgi:DNA-binding response OmpR family regulator